MKKKKIIKVLASVMSLTMMLTACGQTSTESTSESVAKESSSKPVESTEPEKVEESKWPEYLNMDSTYPVIKDEYADEGIKLSVAIVMDATAREWDELWVSRYLKDKYNIELEVEYIMATARDERKNLMMNSGELPDLMWNMSFSTAELVKYGVEEGLLLACDEYISEELTPNLQALMTDDIKELCTAPDDHIYSLPYISDPNEASISRVFINNAYLEAAGLEMPRTLDEFTDAMYKLKEADVTGVGSENFFPIGGGMAVSSSTPYILNALGYNLNYGDNYGVEPCLRDGEVVIPVYDMEVYKEFLTLMNQYYNDGIISSNYFTLDGTEANAHLHEGKNAVFGNVVYTTGLESWNEWLAGYPLTSDWQTEPEAFQTTSCSVGGFVISADTEYPELCMRLADIFYDLTDCAAFWGGTGMGTEYQYAEDGFVNKEWIPEQNNWNFDVEKLPEGYNNWSYCMEYLYGCMYNFGAYGLRESFVNIAAECGGDLPLDRISTLDPVNKADDQYRITIIENVQPYVADSLPNVVYKSEETNAEITNLRAVIDPYAKEQIALFISGGRDLSETDEFIQELKGMGMDDLLAIYQEVYN